MTLKVPGIKSGSERWVLDEKDLMPVLRLLDLILIGLCFLILGFCGMFLNTSNAPQSAFSK